MSRGLVITVLAVDVAMACAGGWFMRRAAGQPTVVTIPRLVTAAETPVAAVTTALVDPPSRPVASERERKRSEPRAVDTAEAVVVAPPPPVAVVPVPDAAIAVVVPPVSLPDAAPAVVVPPVSPPDAEPPKEIVPDEALTDAIRQKIESQREAVQGCYERASKVGSEAQPLAGRVEIHMTVLPEGDVADVRVVKNETGSEALGACLVGLISGWRFPGPPHEAIDYVWPFLFSPAPGARP